MGNHYTDIYCVRQINPDISGTIILPENRRCRCDIKFISDVGARNSKAEIDIQTIHNGCWLPTETLWIRYIRDKIRLQLTCCIDSKVMAGYVRTAIMRFTAVSEKGCAAALWAVCRRWIKLTRSRPARCYSSRAAAWKLAGFADVTFCLYKEYHEYVWAHEPPMKF